MTSLRFGVLALSLTMLVGCAYRSEQPVSNTPRASVQPKMTQPPSDRPAPATATSPSREPQGGIRPTATPRDQSIPATPGPSAQQAPRIAEPARDPVQACIDRIPQGASAAQRSFAEQTCMREYEAQSQSQRNQPFASGTQGDTLQACMARIPSDATSGQRMIAEESCERDENLRRQFGSAPGR